MWSLSFPPVASKGFTCTSPSLASKNYFFIILNCIARTNQQFIFCNVAKQKQQCEHYKQQRKATTEATRLNELVAYVIKVIIVMYMQCAAKKDPS